MKADGPMHAFGARVNEKLYTQAKKVAKRNNHTWRQIMEAALTGYKKGELTVKN